MGSAQSARRIQPGGARPAVPRRADLSRSPFLPTPPPARPFPSPLAGAGAARGRGRGWGRRGTAPRPATGRRRAHFHRRRCAATGSGTAGKARRGRWLGGGGATRGRRTTPPRVLQPPGSSARRIPGPREPDTRRRALLPPLGAEAGPPLPRRDRSPTSPPPRGSRGRGGLSSVRPGRRRAVGPGGVRRSRRSGLRSGAERTGSAAMSATHPTRLETRTKESNACASRGLVRKPPWRNEGEGRPPSRGAPRWDPEASPSPPRAHHRPVSPAAPGRWSTSARVRTRKMVNYAWAGRSQRKLWWRSVAVLTCKSVVRPGYRGERLIEPSSSWFPPKFPSG